MLGSWVQSTVPHSWHSGLGGCLSTSAFPGSQRPRPGVPLRSPACTPPTGRWTPLASCTALRGGWSLITQCPASCPRSPPSGPLPWPLPLPWPDPPTSSPSPSLGSWDGGAVRQAQPPAPMAARRSQRRRGRRGEPGTALLAPLVLSLGLALACLGLLLVVVSLGSWATLSAQVRPSAIPLSEHIRSRKCREADGGREGRGPGDRRRGGG